MALRLVAVDGDRQVVEDTERTDLPGGTAGVLLSPQGWMVGYVGSFYAHGEFEDAEGPAPTVPAEARTALAAFKKDGKQRTSVAVR